jgi:hypothetical protein
MVAHGLPQRCKTGNLYRIVPSIAKGILSKRALYMFNRASEIKSEFDFCGDGGGLPKEMRHFMEWLGDHLRSELQRERNPR